MKQTLIKQLNKYQKLNIPPTIQRRTKTDKVRNKKQQLNKTL